MASRGSAVSAAVELLPSHDPAKGADEPTPSREVPLISAPRDISQGPDPSSEDVEKSLSFTLVHVEYEFADLPLAERSREGPESRLGIIWIRSDNGYWERVGTLPPGEGGPAWAEAYLRVNGLPSSTQVQVLPEGDEPVGQSAYTFRMEPFRHIGRKFA